MLKKPLFILLIPILVFSYEIVIDSSLDKEKYDFIRYDLLSRGEIVIHNGVMWEDTIESSTVSRTRTEAINYCKNLTLEGFNDWYIGNPSMIYDEDAKDYIIKDFKNTSDDSYWKDGEYKGMYFYYEPSYGRTFSISSGWHGFLVRCARILNKKRN